MSLSEHEKALARLLERAHLAGDYDLPELFEEYAAAMGVTPLLVYLADLQQRVLIPFTGSGGPAFDAHTESIEIDSTLAGQAFQRVDVITQQVGDDSPRTLVWLPLLNGTERLGLITVTVSDPDALEADGGALLARLRMFATIAAELVMTKTMYGDTVVRLRRTAEMGLAAEKQWSMLPPLTFGNQRLTISGGLEPAYEVGGDTLDYAVDSRTAHLAIFDGMGHGLRSAQLAALAVSAYRNARRGRKSLARTAHLIDDAVTTTFDGEAFLTGQIAELDTDSGALSWVNAGHPHPLLLRDGRMVKELYVEPGLPIGLGHLLDDRRPQVGSESLEPGDMVLFYSDGVVDARSPSGEFFGIDRLVALVTRHLAAGLPAPETMRRVIRSLLDHQQRQLDDDASLLLVQYRPGDRSALRP